MTSSMLSFLLLLLLATNLQVVICAIYKSPMKGLTTMGITGIAAVPPDNSMGDLFAHPGNFSGAVINTLWSQLEPEQGVYNFSAIEEGLSYIKKYNTMYAGYPFTPVAAKLRVRMGMFVPEWMYAYAGGPIYLYIGHGFPSQPFSRWWSTPFRTAWRQLQNKLAEAYDNSTLLQEVAISSCSTLTTEPFVALYGDPNNPNTKLVIANLTQWNFTDDAYYTCVSEALEDYAAWVNTPIDFTFNQFAYANGTNASSAIPIQIMTSFRNKLGNRAVIANQGLQFPPNPKQTEVDILAAIAELGPPSQFQTVEPNVNWNTTFNYGFYTEHMSEFELWVSRAGGSIANWTAQELEQWGQLMNSTDTTSTSSSSSLSSSSTSTSSASSSSSSSASSHTSTSSSTSSTTSPSTSTTFSSSTISSSSSTSSSTSTAPASSSTSTTSRSSATSLFPLTFNFFLSSLLAFALLDCPW